MSAGRFQGFAMTVAAVCAFFLIDHGIKAYKIHCDQARVQRRKIDELQRFRATYQASEASKRRFETEFHLLPSPRTIDALLAVADFAKYGVETDVDSLTLPKTTPVVSGDVSIGLDRACMATSVDGGSTLFLRAASYQALLNGIARLSARPDIEIGTVALYGNYSFPVAKLGHFCVLLRQS